MLESAGPKTFFVQRFFQGGLNITDGSDELSPWRKNPWLTVDDAEMIRQLPDGAGRVGQRGHQRPGRATRTSNLDERADRRASAPSWVLRDRRRDRGGPELHRRRSTRPAPGSPSSTTSWPRASFPGLDPIGKTDQGVRPAVRGRRRCTWRRRRSSAAATTPRMAIPHTTFVKVADYWKGWMDIAVMPDRGRHAVDEAQDEVIAAMRGEARPQAGPGEQFRDA